MKRSPPATDLSGPKASAESLTPRRKSPAVVAAVDFQSDLFLSPVLSSLLSREGPSWTGSVIAGAATFAEETIRGGKRERFCSLTVGFSVIDRWCGWRRMDLDGILAFAGVLFLTGSAVHYALVGRRILSDRISNRISHHVRWRSYQGRKDEKDYIRSPSGFPLSIDGVDASGLTWTTFLPSPSFSF